MPSKQRDYRCKFQQACFPCSSSQDISEHIYIFYDLINQQCIEAKKLFTEQTYWCFIDKFQSSSAKK